MYINSYIRIQLRARRIGYCKASPCGHSLRLCGGALALAAAGESDAFMYVHVHVYVNLYSCVCQ